jgi:hypothetical protein
MRVSIRFSAAVALLSVGQTALAQGRLLDFRTVSSGIIVENWNFAQPGQTGGAASVVSATQFTVPITAVVPVVPGWALDAYVAYANGKVNVDRGGTVGRDEVSLSGVNDAKIRLVGKLKGDNVLLTLGASLPSGATALQPDQLEALSVMAAPALRFRTPVLGGGPSGTGGLVFAGQAGSWALAFAGAFEVRGNYAPSQSLTAGLGKPALRAGHAVHLSVGADRVVESARQSMSIIADFFTGGELTDPEAGVTALPFRLGPAFTATYQVQATTGDVESMLYVLERVRTNYTVADTAVKGSWRAESELGLINSIPLATQTSLRVGVDGRFHTGPFVADRDEGISAFATAGILAGGGTLGLQYTTRGGGLAFEPYVRAQVGQLDFGGPTRRATGISAGVTLTGRF